MSRRNRIRKSIVKEHRRHELDRSISLLLNGKANPQYVSLRAKKYKEVCK